MNNGGSAIYGALARHVLTTLGGMLVSRGLIEASQLQPAVGACLVLGGMIWSIVQKQRAAK